VFPNPEKGSIETQHGNVESAGTRVLEVTLKIARILLRSSFWLGAAASQVCLIPAVAGTPTSVTLIATPNPTLYGQIVTLTAAVSSASATGNVTFYDGVTVLETEPLAGGIATLFTILLPSGTGSLYAYYEGDATFAASKSAEVSETVDALPGVFQSAVSIDAFGGTVVVGDFNGDGKADLAVGGDPALDQAINILLGNADGTFQPPLTVNLSVCGSSRTLALGDFNGDGKTDLAFGQPCTGVNILLGNGDGTFRHLATYATPGGEFPFIAVGDFNGDGKADLVGGSGIFLARQW
jgi:hypothetical protein